MPAFSHRATPPNPKRRFAGRKFEPVPEGIYVAEITDSEWRMPQSGNGGKFLWLRFDIDRGEHTGRCVFKRLMLNAASEAGRDYATDMLNELITACGASEIKSDVQELHHVLIKIVVKVRHDGLRPAE
jgi:hypothetical protein